MAIQHHPQYLLGDTEHFKNLNFFDFETGLTKSAFVIKA